MNNIVNNLFNRFSIYKKQFIFPAFVLISLFLFTVVAQNKSKNNLISSIPDGEDSLKTNQPQVNYKVNKQYDEHGNLISYDSTYTYSYSSPGADVNITFGNDSAFDMFGNMNMPIGMFNNDIFNRFFKSDSTQFLNNNMFLNDPFFNNGFDMMDQMREQMKRMQQMDSLFKIQRNTPVPNNKTIDPNDMITL
ncbi:MAG: hypothetical protein WCL51_14160 [Bacteroidota bacterium]